MKSIKINVLILVSLVVSVISVNYSVSAANASYTPNIGIWYSTWYANQGNYFWRTDFGANSAKQFLADVDGDGLDDAIVFNTDGTWRVAKSDGTKFLSDSVWVAGHGVGSTKQFVTDVTGDGKADSIIYYSGDGSWYISPSTGNGFGAYYQLKTGFGIGADDAFIADVDGDGKGDAIVYYNTNFSWDVALSTGNSFGVGTQWLTGFGVNASRMAADVDGDGKADAVSMYDGDGSWWVATSNGSGFNGYTKWIDGYGKGSSKQMLADKDNDGKADAITFYTNGPTGGDWQARVSNGSSFVAEQYSYSGEWKYKHGVGSTWQGMGKVFNSEYAGAAPVTFDGSKGKWKVIPSDNEYVKPNTWNTWESGLGVDSREIKYRPKTAGVYGMYDSGDPAVIDEHIKMLAYAQIDFIILDMTNAIDADNKYIINRAKTVMERLAVWNADPLNRKVKYAFAVGFIQFNHNPQSFENEAQVVMEEYVSNNTYGGSDNYYYENGKPLIVSFSSYDDRIAIENWTGIKTYQNQFTIKYAQGRVPEGGNPPVSESGLYYGWVAADGSVPNQDAMLINPGHNPNIGVSVISRILDGVNGGFYERSWDRIIATKPKTVIIGSFNEFAEENAVQPADTSILDSPSEKWYNTLGQLDSDFYWNMTVNKINELLTPGAVTALSVSNVTSSSAVVSLTSNQTGTAYYVLLPASATAPTADQVKLGQDSNNQIVTLNGQKSVTKNVAESIQITGLAQSTNYNLYAVAADGAGNLTNLESIYLLTPAVGQQARAFAITGQLANSNQLTATAIISPINGENHNGTEVVVFQLMKGTEPVSIVALQKDITSSDTLTAHFNVAKTAEHTVRVFVLSTFNSDPAQVGENLAEAIILQ